MAQRQEEDKEKWEKVVANSQLMEDGEGVWFVSFRNVSLGKLPVRALAVAPSLSYRESPTKLPRGHAVLIFVGFELSPFGFRIRVRK